MPFDNIKLQNKFEFTKYYIYFYLLFQGVVIADVNKENGENAIKLLSKDFERNRMKFIKTDVTKVVEFEGLFI